MKKPLTLEETNRLYDIYEKEFLSKYLAKQRRKKLLRVFIICCILAGLAFLAKRFLFPA